MPPSPIASSAFTKKKKKKGFFYLPIIASLCLQTEETTTPKPLASSSRSGFHTKTGLEQTTDTIDAIGDIIKKFGESVLNVIQAIAEYVVPAFRYAIQTGITVMKLYKSVVLVRSVYALSSAANGISEALKDTVEDISGSRMSGL